MKFWQKAYLCVIVIFLISFDAVTYLSVIRSYSLSRSETYMTAENECYVIQSSLDTRISNASSLYKELNVDNLKMYIEPYANYYEKQKIYMELYYNDSLVYSNFPSTLDKRPELQINPGQKSTLTRTADGVSYFFITGYLPKPYSNTKFVYIKDVQPLENFRNEIVYHAILSSAVVFIILSILLLIMLLKLTAPIRKLNQGAEEIAAGHYQKRVEIKSRDEIGELALNFNKMADSVETHIEKLSDLTANRQQFINNLAHEMRTPITAILGYGESMKYANLSEDERMKAIDYIISQSERMKSMAGKLMELTNLTHENIHFEKINLESITEHVVASLSQNILEKQIEIIKSFQKEEILGDKDLIESLIQNLVENSIRALPDKGKIEIKTFREDNRIVLSIEDNGIGMSENDISKVFEPFYRADKSRSRAYGGAGLGLALCKTICDLHGADIHVTSQANKGTRFEIKFTTPLHPCDKSEK